MGKNLKYPTTFKGSNTHGDKCSGKGILCLSRLRKPYLDTSTSKQVEYTKAFEITIIKELGKLTP